MFDLPKTTEIKKNIYKNIVYKKFPQELSGKNRDRFERDINKITIINEISEQSLNVPKSDKVSAIYVIKIDLKTKDYLESNILLISKLFGQKLLVALHYDNKYRLAVYETKLLVNEWRSEDDIKLKLTGLDIGKIWENLVIQVADIKIEEGNTLNRQLEIEIQKSKLRDLIETKEKQARRETQAKKKLELFKEIQRYKNELREL